MKKSVFYSWQSDRDYKTGRELVRKALADAIRSLNADTDVDEPKREPVVLDSDTKGVPGSPPIVQTIFKKIEEAHAFVADLTFIANRPDGRMTPNPNVTIEYGYALKALSHSGILGVMNAHYGAPSIASLPFDLGHMLHPLAYDCPPNADDETISKQRTKLASQLKGALKAILDNVQPVADTRGLHQPLVPRVGLARFRAHDEPMAELYSGLFAGAVNPQPVVLKEGSAMWLRVMPKFEIEAELLVTAIHTALRDIGHGALNLRDGSNPFALRGADGFGYAPFVENGLADAVVYGFASGEIWSIDTSLLRHGPTRIFFDTNNFVEALKDYTAVLKRLGVSGPYRWEAGMEGVKGRELMVNEGSSPFPTPPLLKDMVKRNGEYSGNPEDAEAALEPFFAAVYDAASLSRR